MTIKRDKYKTLRRKENISFQYNCNLKKKTAHLPTWILSLNATSWSWNIKWRLNFSSVLESKSRTFSAEQLTL